MSTAQFERKLEVISSRSDLAKTIFQLLAGRMRERDVTDLRRIRELLSDKKGPVDTEEFNEIFKTLEKEGFGKIIYPTRPGHSHKFKWFWSMKNFKTALSNKDAVATSSANSNGVKNVFTYKTPTLTVRIELEGNMNTSDVGLIADELKRFVGT